MVRTRSDEVKRQSDLLGVDLGHLADEVAAAKEYQEGWLSDLPLLYDELWPGRVENSTHVLTDQRPSRRLLFQHMSALIPKLIWGNPRVNVGSTKRDLRTVGAQALHLGMNDWIVQRDYRSPALRTAYDYMLKWSVTHTRVARISGLPRFSFKDPQTGRTRRAASFPHWPEVTQVPISTYFHDHKSLNPFEARFRCQRVARPRAWLMKMAQTNPGSGWNMSVIDKVGGAELETTRDRGTGPTRDDIVMDLVWVPEYALDPKLRPEDGYNGTLFHLLTDDATDVNGNSMAGVQPREPQAYYGPPDGPWDLGGAYWPNDESYPYGPAEGTSGIRNMAEELALSEYKAMKAYKRMIWAKNTEAGFGNKIKNAPDQYIFEYNSESPKEAVINNLEIGGTTPHGTAQVETLVRDVEQAAGMQSARSGGLSSGKNTATEHALADQGAAVREGFNQKEFVAHHSRTLRKVAWYMHRTKRIMFPLRPDRSVDPRADVIMQQPWFHGGSQEGEPLDSFEAMGFEVEATSMSRADEAQQQRNALILNENLQWMIPMAAQVPGFPWKRLGQLLGDGLNINGVDELLSDYVDWLEENGMPVSPDPLNASM
ncbi:MAG: hypothetical protein B7733_06110, partial [Myxococcales bacterium FL481]